MTILHLGVDVYPYGAPPKKSKRGKTKTALKASAAITTGDVAEILEAKYHVMELFYQSKQKQIAGELESSVGGALENMMMGAPPASDPFGSATSKIAEMFNLFITTREIEKMGYPGIPTRAALDGVNHRLLHPFAKSNPRRPSFVDTGQYVGAFRAWVDG